MISYIRKLYVLFNAWSKGELLLLLAMMLGMAFLEMIGISLFLPLIQAIISPDQFGTYPIISDFIDAGGEGGSKNLVATMAIIIFIFFVVKNLALLFVVWFQSRFINNKIAEFSTQLLKMYLSMSYGFYLQRHSSELTRNIYESTPLVLQGGLLSILNLLLEGLMIMGVVTVLFIVEPVITLSAIVILGAFIAVFYGAVRNRLESWGREKQTNFQQKLQWISQSFGAIKETKVLGRESYFVSAFAKPTYRIANIATYENIINRAVSASSEVVLIGGMVLILILSISAGGQDSLGEIMTTLGMFAVAGFRVLPSANKLTVNLIKLRKSLAAIDDIYDDMVAWKEDHSQQDAVSDFPPMRNGISIENISLQYDGASNRSVSDLTANIKKGQTVALIGASGAGKSSLADLILGLHAPSNGRIAVDGRDINDNLRGWQRHLGYVPQTIYLVDDTMRRNIAFGIDEQDIDEDAVSAAVRMANLEQFVAGLEGGLDTLVGENGVRLSGGQRQRIGIARALYHDPDVLILDEATSALDSETEREISDALGQLRGQKTMIIIAHRLSTVKDADVLLLLSEGKLIDCGTFEELSRGSAEFQRLIQQGGAIIDQPAEAVTK